MAIPPMFGGSTLAGKRVSVEDFCWDTLFPKKNTELKLIITQWWDSFTAQLTQFLASTIVSDSRAGGGFCFVIPRWRSWWFEIGGGRLPHKKCCFFVFWMYLKMFFNKRDILFSQKCLFLYLRGYLFFFSPKMLNFLYFRRFLESFLWATYHPLVQKNVLRNAT